MDVNDNFPEFAVDYHPVVYENQPPGQTVVQFSAVDRDTVANGAPFEFWLPCAGSCPCHGNPTCNDFALKFLPGWSSESELKEIFVFSLSRSALHKTSFNYILIILFLCLMKREVRTASALV